MKRWLKNLVASPSRRARKASRRPLNPQLLQLEDRLVPTIAVGINSPYNADFIVTEGSPIVMSGTWFDDKLADTGFSLTTTPPDSSLVVSGYSYTTNPPGIVRSGTWSFTYTPLDGTTNPPSTPPISSFSVIGHNDQGDNSAPLSIQPRILNAPPAFAATPPDQFAIAGKATNISLGSFTDPGVNDALPGKGGWQVDVDWNNDGTYDSTTYSAQNAAIQLSHTFGALNDPPSNTTVKVRITDKDGGFTTTTFNVQIDNASATTYVNSAWASFTDGTIIPDADPTVPGNQQGTIGYNAFGTISGALPYTAANGTVKVQAGTYAENVAVTKSVTILGPNAGIDPNTGTRVPEAIVVPATTETSLQGSTSGTVFRLGTNSGHINVTIDGLTVDGHNASLTGGRTLNGVEVDTGAGIVNSIGSFDANPGGYDVTMTASNDIIQNFERYGVLADNTAARTPTTGTLVSHNKIDNLPSGNNFGGGRGRAAAFEENVYGTFSDNVVTRVDVGWQDDNYNSASPGAGTLVTGNEIHTYHRGIFHNLQYQDATAITISNNKIFQETTGDFPASGSDFGIELASLQSAVGATLANNDDSGNTYGLLLWNLPTTGAVSISGGTLTGNKYGVWATSQDPQFGAAAASSAATVSGLAVVNPTVAGIAVDNSTNAAATSIALGAGNSVSGGPLGVLVSGPSTGFVGNTLNNLSLTGTTNYIQLTGGAAAGATIDGTAVSYDGTLGSALTKTSTLSGYAVEDKISHSLDDSANGFVRTTAGTVWVTTNTAGIQHGIDAAASGDTVNVTAGTFIGRLDVTKPLTLLGANSGITAGKSPGTRGAETIILPEVSNPDPYSPSAVNVVYVETSNVTIDGFTVDGDNPGLTSAVDLNGANIDASEGIVSYEGVGNIAVRNNIVRNTSYTGIDFDDYNNGGKATSGNVIADNFMDNLGGGGFSYGIGVVLYDNFYATVTGNKVDRARVGVQTGNFSNANPGAPAVISDNDLTVDRLGIFYNLHYSNATAFTLADNTIQATTLSGNKWFGIFISSQQTAADVTITNNTIDGSAGSATVTAGYVAWNTPTTATISVEGGSVTGVQYGVWVNNYEGYASNADDTSLTVDGVDITASQIGVYALDSALNTNGSKVHVTVLGNTKITTGGAGTGVKVEGSDASAIIQNNAASIHGNAIGIDVDAGSADITSNHIYDNVTGIRFINGGSGSVTGNDFEGGANPDNGTDLRLDSSAGAISGGVLTGNTFAGATYIDQRAAQNLTALETSNIYKRDNATVETDNFAIEDRVYHKIDNAASGLVTWVPGLILVTPAATPTATDNDYTRLANAVSAASNGSTIDLQGTFDWSESNAAASWAAGNDATTGTGDDYSILMPALSGLTITASGGLGTARIQGPGDLAAVNLESVFHFDSVSPTDKWQGLTISNLEIFDFDWSIAMENDGGPSDAFSGTHIVNNHIRIANDLNDVVAPADVNQNIGIHYSFGKNQVIQGNTIDIPGDGVSDPSADLTSNRAAFSSVVGMQSNTSGGDVYDGLLIDGNTLNVLHAQDAKYPQRVIGIWENASGHSSNITVSNNKFYNLDATNDPTRNLQQAFWVTSHSSASSTVLYSGNVVVGASVGFKWLGAPEYPGADFSGTLPVVMTGNTLTNVNTGFLLQSNGSAVFSGNSLSNSGAMANVGTGISIAAGSSATIDGSTLENDISGFATGVLVSGAAIITGNAASIHGNTIGIDVNGGSAAISGNHIYANATGIRFTNGGRGSVASNDFGGATDNATDLLLTATAGSVTAVTTNSFAGDTFYIDDQSTASIDATSDTFDVADNFRIEDRMHHRVDTDLPVTTGLVTWVAGNLFVTDAGTDHSIQRGIDAASAGNTVNVEAGTYAQNPTVNKPITLLGANAGLAGGGARGTESDVVTNGNQNAVFTVTASNATIDGFKIDGDDISVTGGTLSSGEDANVLYAVQAVGALSNVTVQNNILTHSFVGFWGNGPASGTAVSGSLITNNWFDSIGAYDFGYAVTLRTNFYADVTDNKMTRVHTGLHTNNFYLPGGPATWNFQGNIISVYGNGLWQGLTYSAATPLTIDGNTVTGLGAAPTVPGFAAFDGKATAMMIVTLQDKLPLILTNNTITGMPYGVILYNTVTSGPVVINDTNTITNNGIGVYLTDIVGFNPQGTTMLGGTANNPNGTAHATLDGLSAAHFSGNGIGVLVRGVNTFVPYGVSLTLANGTAINGGATGLQVDGSHAKLAGDTLGATAFTGQSGQYVTLSTGAYFGQEINGTVATFGGKTGASASKAENYAIEDKITHAIDDATLGFIRVKASNVFVTQNSGSIQRGVNAASTGDNINVDAGTFHELVLVPKTVVLLGAESGVDARTRIAVPETVVDNGDGDFQIEADNVAIDGFTLQGATNNPSDPPFTALGAAIWTNPGFSGTHGGHTIVNNIIQGNIAGIELDNDGTIQTTVQRNLFQNNTQPGPNGGFDIEADFGLANAKIDSNTFTNSAFVEAAWAFGVEGTGDQISFTNNDESNHGRGAFFYGTSNSTVTGNSFTGASHYAVALFGYLGSPANSAFLISGNTFNVNGSGGAGVELQDSGGTAYAGSLTLAGNQYSTSGSDLSIRNESATLIDATGETFNGVLASGAGTAGQFTIVDTIVDGVDVSGYGLVRTKAGNVYVTPNSFFAPATTTPSVQRGVNAASANDTVNVNSGTYIDDVTIGTTGLSLLGQGLAATTISGAIGGPGSTVFVAASNVTIDGFTITREGNNPSDWNNPNLNTAGISLGASSNNVLISNNRLDGNRTGIDINNSGSAFIHIRNNSIDTNRTGMILRNVTTNVLAEENAITGNFTVGIVFLDASGGTNSPLQTATGSHFNNNNISGNWYGQIVDRQTGGSLPAPGANPKDFNGNWFGTATPAYSTLNSTEPGYAAQIPVIFGGSATAPGGQPDVLGPASANFDFTPFLLTGTDTDVETVPGRGTNGFQGDFSQLGVTTQGSQIGGSGRIQEAIDDLPSGGTIHVLSGNYSTEDVDANKPLTLQLQPSTDAVPTTTTTIQSLSGVAAATLDLNGDTLQAGGAANSTFDGVLIGVSGSHFVKQGSGMLTLTGSSPAGLGGFNGSTSVNNGTLALSGTLGGDADVTGTLTVTGTLQGNAIVFGTLDGSGGTVNGSVTVASGGLLAGSGSVGGANVQSGGLMTRTGTVATSLTNAGTVSPGGSGSGSLSVGSFTQTSGGTLVVDVNNVPPVASDHITVTAGTVALAGTIAVNSTGAAIALFTSIPVITNTGGTTSGHFIGLLNGYFIVAGANTFQVSYTGGGGHDVTLFTVPDASLHTTTYANVAWASLPDGTLITDPNVGPGTYVGYTAFATIQAAIDHTQPAGTILVFAGSYASDSANLHGDTQTVKLINGANVVVSGPLAGSNAGAKVLFNKGSLTIGDGSSSSFAGQLTGLTNTTGFVKQGAGTLTLSNSADDYSGPTRVNAGSLQAGTDEVIPNFSAVTLAGGTLDLNGYWETIGSLAGSGTVALGSGGKLSTGDANTSTTFGGQIAGTGDLVKQGAGALTLTGANTFSGGVDVQAGSLVIGGASTPTANAITVEEGASLGINRTDGTTASPFVFGNAIDGSGTIVQSGSGVTRFTGLSAFQGDLSITKGTVVASADSQLGGGNVAVNAPGALLIDGSFTTTRNITADTTAAISIASGKVLTLDAAILTGGTLNGPGSVSSTDGTVFNGTFVGPNGSLSVDGPTTLTNVTNSGSVAVANGQTAALNAFSNASGGVLTVNGTANASGFTTTGQATVNGTLTNVGASKLTFGGGSVTYIGTTGLVDVGSTGAYASGGLIRNMGAFGNATGTTTVDYGARFAAVTGSVDANIVTQNGGVYAPGSSPGTGTSSAFNVNGGGVYEFELSNATGTAGALSGWDTVNVQPTVFSPTSGTLNLSATPANKYTVRVATRLNSGSYSTPGAAANFDPNQPYAWKFISADNVQDTINGTFNADAFQIDSSAFANPVNGKFSIEARDGGKNFYVVYTPSDNVANIVVNNGAAQRSRLTTITVNFINPVDTSTLIGLGAITLTGTAATQSGVVGTIVQTGASGANGRILVSSTSGIASSITLTFDNADGSPVTAGVEYGSLADYRWQLAIPSQNYTSTLNDPNLRRLFGDFNNDGTVDGTDFGNLGTAFGQTVANSPFDYNVDGTVDGTDFAEFGTRFGVTL